MCLQHCHNIKNSQISQRVGHPSSPHEWSLSLFAASLNRWEEIALFGKMLKIMVSSGLAEPWEDDDGHSIQILRRKTQEL